MAENALWQMQQDQILIDNLPHQTDIIARFYEWTMPTITYGCFLDPMDYLTAEIPGFEMVKRPTGGGMLFHVDDFPFTVSVPATHPKFSTNVLENYRFVNEAVIAAIREVLGETSLSLIEQSQNNGFLEFCMATPTRYDIMLDGYKVGGAAERKTKYGFVHQAALFLKAPPWHLLEQYVRGGKEAVLAMQKNAAFLPLGNKRKELQEAIAAHLLQ